jgi:hypothetical protein
MKGPAESGQIFSVGRRKIAPGRDHPGMVDDIIFGTVGGIISASMGGIIPE